MSEQLTFLGSQDKTLIDNQGIVELYDHIVIDHQQSFQSLVDTIPWQHCLFKFR